MLRAMSACHSHLQAPPTALARHARQCTSMQEAAVITRLAWDSLLMLCSRVCIMLLSSQVLQPLLSDADREPAVRLALLQLLDSLLDSLLEGPSTAGVFVGSSSNADLTLHSLLLPPLVWRAGKVCFRVQVPFATGTCNQHLTFCSSTLTACC